MMKILIKEQVIRMYNKIEIEHNFEQLVKNVIRDTTLSQKDITNWLITHLTQRHYFYANLSVHS